MAVTFTDDFVGTLDETLESRTGWTTSGVFPPDAQGLKINGSDQVKNTSGNGCLAYVEGGAANSYSEAQVYGPLSAATNISVCVRCVDYNNFIGMRAWDSSNIELFHRTGSTANNRIGSIIGGLSLVAGDVWRLEVENDVLRAYINDVQIGTDEDVTGIQSGSKVGLFSADSATDPVFDTFEAGTVGVANIITITEDADRKVYPNISDSAQKTIAGTYVGTPTTIEYRVEDYDSGVVVPGHDWQVIDPSPSGGTYSSTVSLPKGDWYKVRTRWSNDTGVAAETTNRFGVGILVENAGQSNAVSQFTNGSVVVPDDRTSIFDGSSIWTLPNGQHAISWMNQLAQEEGCVVGAFDTAAGSSSITAHVPGGGNYPTRVSEFDAAGGDVNFMLWTQGEADASSAMPQAAYEGHLATLYADILSRTGRTSANCPMFIVVTGREDGISGNDSGWQGIRQAQKAFADATTDVEIALETVTFGMEDSLHYDTASKALLSVRLGQSIIKKYGYSVYDGRGPEVSGIQWGGTGLEIAHDLNGASDLSLTGAITGYEVSVDDFSTTEVISSSVASANKITFTMSSPLSGVVKVRSMYGQDPDVSNVPTADFLSNINPYSMTLPVTGLEVSGPSFTGNISNQVNFVSDSVSIDVSSNWTESPNSYTVTSGVLPDGLTLSNAGVISGVLTTNQNLVGIVITAGNLAGTAASNSFDWNVQSVDTTPDPFTFTPVTDAELNSSETSNVITVTGINTASNISITGGEYSVNGGAYTSSPSTVEVNDQVQVRLTSSLSYNTLVSCTLDIGGVTGSFDVTTRVADIVPNPFTLTDVTDVETNALTTSNIITVSGVDTGVNIPISINNGGEYSVNGGSYTSNSGTVQGGDTVRVRLLSSVSYNTGVSTTLAIGGVTDIFTVTTRVADTTPDQFTFTPQTNVALDTLVISNSITITGVDSGVSLSISVSGGEYSVNGGTYTSTSGNAELGDVITVRQTSSSTGSTLTTTTLNISGVTDDFNVTTVATVSANISDTLVVDNNDTPYTTANVKYWVLNSTTNTVVDNGTVDPNVSGIISIDSNNMVVGVTYMLVIQSADNTRLSIKEVTAV